MRIATFLIVVISLILAFMAVYFGLMHTDKLVPETTPEPIQQTEPELAAQPHQPVSAEQPSQGQSQASEGEPKDPVAPPLETSVEEVDADSDGKIEMRKHFEGGKLKKAELDRDKDGDMDIWSYYEGGVPIRQEADLNNDGQVDTWSYFKKGVKVKQEMDKNYDGKKDAWFYYSGTGIDIQGSKIDEDFDGTIDKVMGEIPEEE